MNRMPRHLTHLFVGILAVGCSDAVGNGGPGDSGADDVKIVDNGPQDTGSDDLGAPDTGTPDTGPPDVGAPDSSTPDTGPADNGPLDVGPDDTGAPDATPPDATAADSGRVDAGGPDVAPADASPVDAARPDTGATDAAPTDTTPVDTGSVDSGVDVPRDVAMDVTDAAVDAVACTPSAEICNGRDDDCDGLVDESACGAHLLVTEVVVSPTEAEFVEVHNPTGAPVDLSTYYVTDAHDYACYLGRTCTITGRSAMTLDNTDFVAHFPTGATIPAGGHVTVAIASPAAFSGIHGRCPDFYLPSRAVLGDAGVAPVGSCAASRAMVASPSTASSIGSTAGLGNAVELVMLFRWDGAAALVEDVDYVFWGTPTTTNLQVDKSVTSVMGTAYRADTPAATQQRARAPDTGASLVRCDYAETGERRTGGNGVGGHDETSEPLAATWRNTTASTARDDAGLLTSVNATPGALNDCR